MRFLTTGEVAEALQVTIPTVKRWIRDGHIAAYRTAGGHYRVSEEECARFQTRLQAPASVAIPPRVLIVDDNDGLRSTLVDAFGGKGYRVEAAKDGYEGLIKVGTFKPHLLILDLRMPGMDGFQVCRKVKDDSETRTTKILAITGYAEGNARARILDAGADAFIEKPFQLAVLHAEAERLLAQPGGVPQPYSSLSAQTT